MLQTIREHTQGWIAGIIIGVIILSFALWGIHSYFVGGVNTNVVATIDGTEITKDQIALAYDRMRRQVQTEYGANMPITGVLEAEIKKHALQTLIEMQILKQAALKQGYLVANPQVDSYLESMPEFQVNGRFSINRFQEVLSSTLLSTDDFLNIIRTNLMINQPKLGIIFSSFALPGETENTVSLINQARDFQYAEIVVKNFSSLPIVISADKVRAFYNQHQMDYKTPEQVSVEYVELSLNDILPTIQTTEAMIKNFYNENLNSYSQPMQWRVTGVEIPFATSSEMEIKHADDKAKEIAQQLSQGADISTWARQFPVKTLKVNEWLTLSNVSPEVQKILVKFVKPNQVLGPIKIGQNMLILKALAINEPKILSYDNVKEKIKENLIRQQAEEKFVALREQLANVAYEHPDSLQEVAKLAHRPIKTSELFAKNKAGKDISFHPKVRDIAFSHDVLDVQNNSDVIPLNAETMLVLRVKSHLASRLLPLQDVAKQITEKLRQEELNQQVAALANTIKEKLQSGVSPDKVAEMYHLLWVNVGYLERYATKVDPAILEAAFSAPKPTETIKTYTTAKLTSGYAIVVVKGVKKGVVADKKQYNIFAEQVQDSLGVLEYDLYKASLSKKAHIAIEGQS